MFLAVMAIVRFVRPWYAWSRTATPRRPVAWRAILTAFSTASAPELTNAEFFARWRAGTRGSISRDLPRVPPRLRTGVEQRRLLRMLAGRDPRQHLADLDVALVRRDHEA